MILPRSKEGFEINVCAEHGKEHDGSALTPDVPFEPIVSKDAETVFKNSAEVKTRSLFKPLATLSKISVYRA